MLVRSPEPTNNKSIIYYLYIGLGIYIKFTILKTSFGNLTRKINAKRIYEELGNNFVTLFDALIVIRGGGATTYSCTLIMY